MTFYDWQNDMELGPCRIIDGECLEWEMMLQLDTETGQGAQMVVRPDASVGPEDVKLPLPITVEPIDRMVHGDPNAPKPRGVINMRKKRGR